MLLRIESLINTLQLTPCELTTHVALVITNIIDIQSFYRLSLQSNINFCHKEKYHLRN